MRLKSLAGLVATFFLACAPSSTARPGQAANIITKEELLGTHASNVYDAISRLRPNFLLSRGQTTLRGADTGYPKVYQDRILLGDVNSLRSMSPTGIREIRYYNGPEASGRFGLDNVSGAIEVISDTGQ
jgi:hypothetical protein